MNQILKNMGSRKINYLTLSDELSARDDRLRTYYYTCMPFQSNPPTSEESQRYSKVDNFIHQLRGLPRFEVKLGRLQRITNGTQIKFTQKGVDMMLGVDLVKMSMGKQIDRAVVITADSDFVYAVQAVKDAGVLTTLYYSQLLPVNQSLLDVFDESQIIDQDLLNKCPMSHS